METFATQPRVASEPVACGIDAIPDPRLRDLASYWFSKRAGELPPRRADIDPLQFKPILPNILLLDRVVEAGRVRYRYRLVGTTVVAITGRELTGRFLDEMLPLPYGDYVQRLHDMTLQHRTPVYSLGLYHDEGNFINGLTYRLLMPLRTAGEEPDMVFVCQFWQRRNDPGHWSGDWQKAEPEIALISGP